MLIKYDVTCTLNMSDMTHALSCIISLIDTPIDESILHSSDIPPGRSLTVTLNLIRRPSAARPRSKHRPKTVESIFPPDNMQTTLKFQFTT